MNDALGKRIKTQYEERTRFLLPRRTYTIIRLDGKAFHTFTKNFQRPYDLYFMDMMNKTAEELCSKIQGARFAYVQSDEINILVTDFETIKTDAWFDGNIQKIASISASIATAKFNTEYRKYRVSKCQTKEEIEKVLENLPEAHFDSRVFSLSDPAEAANVFIWRQLDATKNSILMLSHVKLGHKKMQNQNTSELQDSLMAEHNVNWNNEIVGFKRGRIIVKETYVKPADGKSKESTRSRWIAKDPPIFTKDKEFLQQLIPIIK